MSDRPYRVYRGGQPGGSPDDPELALPGPAGRNGGRRRRRAPSTVSVAGPSCSRPPGAARRPPRSRQPRRRGDRVAGVPGVGSSGSGCRPAARHGVWLVAGYLAFRDSVERANARLERITRAAPVAPVLDQQSGLLLSQPTTILVMGRDRNGLSDSLQLIRVDPGRHLVSDARDPARPEGRHPRGGFGQDQRRRTRGAGRRSRSRPSARSRGVPVNHVVLIDFSGLPEAGRRGRRHRHLQQGTARRPSSTGTRTTSRRGALHLNGERALAYARIRKNADNAADSDVTRGQRQQRVMARSKHKLVSPASLFRLRSVGSHAADPLATDLSANQLLQLGWGDFRAQRHLNCNLGGEPVVLGGSPTSPACRRTGTRSRPSSATRRPAAGTRRTRSAPGCS